MWLTIILAALLAAALFNHGNQPDFSIGLLLIAAAIIGWFQ